MTRDRDRTWPQCEEAGCTTEASQPVGEPKLCIAHAYDLDRQKILCHRCREHSSRRHAHIEFGGYRASICERCVPEVRRLLLDQQLEPPAQKQAYRCDDCGQAANITLVLASSDQNEHVHHYCGEHLLSHITGRIWELRK